jgi:hypothetical protein
VSASNMKQAHSAAARLVRDISALDRKGSPVTWA